VVKKEAENILNIKMLRQKCNADYGGGGVYDDGDDDDDDNFKTFIWHY
jgi:hypothetical protein